MFSHTRSDLPPLATLSALCAPCKCRQEISGGRSSASKVWEENSASQIIMASGPKTWFGSHHAIFSGHDKRAGDTDSSGVKGRTGKNSAAALGLVDSHRQLSAGHAACPAVRSTGAYCYDRLRLLAFLFDDSRRSGHPGQMPEVRQLFSHERLSVSPGTEMFSLPTSPVR